MSAWLPAFVCSSSGVRGCLYKVQQVHIDVPSYTEYQVFTSIFLLSLRLQFLFRHPFF